MAPIEINDPEEFHKAFSSPKPFIIYYYTTWCSGCRRLKFSIQTAADAEEYADLPIYKVDCDSDKLWQVVPEDVIGFPTTIAYRAGKAFSSYEREPAYEPLKMWIDSFIRGCRVADTITNNSQYNDLRSSSRIGSIGASTLTRNVAGESTDSVVSKMSVASSLAEVLVPCTGGKALKMKPGWRDHLLGSRHWKDGEAHCMFAPILGDDGIEVACAISNKSRVSITIAHTPSPNKGDLQVTFGMGFSVNVNVKARFTSAIFCVTFQRYVDQTTLTSLNIHDLWPRDEKGEGTEVVVGAEQVVNAGFQAGTQGATLQGGLSRQHNKSYTLKTSSRVRGQGLRTPTATWTFEEDRGQAGKEGLEPEYPLHVHFSHQHADAISIKFYAEAVLMEGSKKTVLTIGNEKELFVRELILSV